MLYINAIQQFSICYMQIIWNYSLKLILIGLQNLRGLTRKISKLVGDEPFFINWIRLFFAMLILWLRVEQIVRKYVTEWIFLSYFHILNWNNFIPVMQFIFWMCTKRLNIVHIIKNIKWNRYIVDVVFRYLWIGVNF